MCGVDENEVKGNSTGSGFACVGPLDEEDWVEEGSLEGDGRGGKGDSGAARGSVIVEDSAQEQEQVQQASGTLSRQKVNDNPSPGTFHRVLTSQNKADTRQAVREQPLRLFEEAQRGKEAKRGKEGQRSGRERVEEEARIGLYS